MLRISAFLLSIFLAHSAFAGAWLREKDSGFSSLTASGAMTLDFGQKTYLEYGVRHDLTLGAELGFLMSANSGRSDYATLFLRRPIGDAEGPNLWAYELGIGASWTGETVNPYLRTGLSWGRGYTLGTRSGWVGVDATIQWDVYNANHLLKLDSTVGMNFNDRFSVMVQVFHARVNAGATTSIAPSLVVRPLKKRPHIRLKIGTETQIGNTDATAFKISFWHDF